MWDQILLMPQSKVYGHSGDHTPSAVNLADQDYSQEFASAQILRIPQDTNDAQDLLDNVDHATKTPVQVQIFV